MNFSEFSKSSSLNIILFQNHVPIKNVSTIKFYQESTSGNISKKEFRWSFDSDYWSSWENLNQGTMSGLAVNDNQYLFLQIKYTLAAINSGDVTSFSIEYDVNKNQSVIVPIQFEQNIPPFISHVTDASTLDCKNGDYYLSRSNHKGSQPISSVTDLEDVINNFGVAIQDVSASINRFVSIEYVDSSLVNRDINLNNLKNYIDASLSQRDISINSLQVSVTSLLQHFVTINNVTVSNLNIINISQPSGKQVRFYNTYDSSGNQIFLQITPDSSYPYSINVYSSDTYNNVRFELICY